MRVILCLMLIASGSMLVPGRVWAEPTSTATASAPTQPASPSPAPATQDAPLPDPPAAPDGHRTMWKVSLGTSLGVFVAGTVVAVYGYYESQHPSIEIAPNMPGQPGRGVTVTSDDCGESVDQISMAKGVTIVNPSVFHHACNWRTRAQVGQIVGMVGLVGAVVSLVMVLRGHDSGEAVAAGSHPAHRVVIAPVVTPTTSGASLSLTW
jgi:hypothetical protein